MKSVMLALPHFVFETLGFGIAAALVLHPNTAPQIEHICFRVVHIFVFVVVVSVLVFVLVFVFVFV